MTARGPVRDEDAFDVPAVDSWLRQQTELPAGLPEVKQFSGGASNLTYLLRYAGPRPDPAPAAGRDEGQGRARHGPRVPDPGRRSKPVFPYVPTMVAHCNDDAVIGSEFYVMERVAGTIPRRIRARRRPDARADPAARASP